jgi:hypothetical protein
MKFTDRQLALLLAIIMIDRDTMNRAGGFTSEDIDGNQELFNIIIAEMKERFNS